MKREQIIEKAAEVLAACDGNALTERIDEIKARAVLDAILPQVTTVAELEALPVGTLFVTSDGYPYRPSAPGFLVSEAYGLTPADEVVWPLTVVWQPEATS